MKKQGTIRRLDAALGAGLLLAMLITPLAGFGQRCAQVRQEVLRLHILANSDSEADQALKLRVRDAVLEETGGLFAAAGTLEEAQAAALENLPAIEAAARRALAEAGSDAPVKAELTRMYFNTREYGEDTTLPAGEYQALRLSIGEARGRNWWCVMFPPLCVPAAEAAVEGQESKAAEEDIEALNQEPHYRLSFAVVEWLEELAAE
ncbi:MAG: stage II sporulation protein R [Angelakisella sp.]|jgi:stage II sporulation protein R|nr:stage II sporulation protein R [Angelakisella sp.]